MGVFDKYLISEQSGFKTTVICFLVSLSLGMLFNAIFSQNRIQKYIRTAADQISPDIRVQFDSAKISVSDGFFPRLAIIINNISIDSDKTCWMSPEMSLNEMVVPLSPWNWIFNGKGIEQIEMDQLKIHFRSQHKPCQNTLSASAIAAAAASDKITSAAISLSVTPTAEPPSFLQNNILKKIVINKVEVKHDVYTQFPFVFNHTEVTIGTKNTLNVIVNAKLQLIQDEIKGAWLGQGNVHIEYSDQPDNILTAHLFGRWREGYYSFMGNCDFYESKCYIENHLKQIPLVEIMHALHQLKLADSTKYNSQSVWVSLRAKTELLLDKKQKNFIEVSDFLVEGDLGSIKSRSFHVSMDPFSISSAAQFDLNQVNISNLMNLIKHNRSNNTLGHLGLLDGRVDIAENNKVHFEGMHSGLQFIFSNKGRSEPITFKKINSELFIKKEGWQLNMKEMELVDGSIDGSVHVINNSESGQAQASIDIQKLLLPNSVKNLMTQSGEVGPIDLKMKMSYENNKIHIASGSLSVTPLIIEKININKLKLSISSKEDQNFVNVNIDNMGIQKDSPVYSVIESFMPKEELINIESLRAQIKFHNFNNFQWLGTKALINKKWRYETDGGWAGTGALDGRILIKELNKNKKETLWKIQGTREKPEFILEDI